MNYIGSKLTLLNFIDDSIKKVVKEPVRTFCDIFSGTGAVGSFFKQKGYQIIANDMQYYSYVLNKHYIGNHKELLFDRLDNVIDFSNIAVMERKQIVCDYLMALSGENGFIYNNYSLAGTENKEFERIYFSDENAKKCDAIRNQIEIWKKCNNINENEYFFLLTSLLEAIDKTANTASVYGAFLKKLKKSAQNPMKMIPAKLTINDQEHFVYNENANDLIKNIKADILYLDPPYNERQYCSNYHILETIAKNDNPTISGKTGLRDYKAQKSEYCSKAFVKDAFVNLIKNANVRYIFLSYNNEGLLKAEDIKEVLSQKGNYGCFTKEYARFRADSNRDYKAHKTVEYLHYCEVKL